MPADQDPHPSLTPQQGQLLIALARSTLAARLAGKDSEPRALGPETRFQERVFQAHCGVFVTLKIQGALRGCIGHLTGREPLVEGVRSNAVNAALHDPRFEPLTAAELERATIEVSVLTPPRPMSYSNAAELIGHLRPGVDGVTIRKASAGATFLPQVWDQLPQKESFLGHLCLKAGLPDDAWRKGDIDVETYQVQSFTESEA